MTTNEPKLLLLSLWVILVGGLAGGAAAAVPEPVVWTTLPDPDPNFVPSPPQANPKVRRRQVAPGTTSAEQSAFEAGQEIGRAARQVDEAIARATKNACDAAEGSGGAGTQQSYLANWCMR